MMFLIRAMLCPAVRPWTFSAYSSVAVLLQNKASCSLILIRTVMDRFVCLVIIKSKVIGEKDFVDSIRS